MEEEDIESLEDEIERLEGKLEEKKKKLKEERKSVVIYMHGDYTLGETMEEYNLTEEQAEEVCGVLYEVALEYNFKTKKLKVTKL